MKKLLLLALLAFFTMSTFTSCSGDDDQPIIENPDTENPDNEDDNDDDNDDEAIDLENAFRILDEEYPLKDGFYEYWGQDEDSGAHTWDVNLLSTNFEFVPANQDFPFEFEDDVVSTLLFELNTNTIDNLVTGVYEIDEDNFAPMICSYFDLALECDFSDLDADEEDACQAFYFIESGTIEIVEVEGNNFEFKIDAVTEEGHTIEAHYQGSLLDLDFEGSRPSQKTNKDQLFNKKRR